MFPSDVAGEWLAPLSKDLQPFSSSWFCFSESQAPSDCVLLLVISVFASVSHSVSVCFLEDLLVFLNRCSPFRAVCSCFSTFPILLCCQTSVPSSSSWLREICSSLAMFSSSRTWEFRHQYTPCRDYRSLQSGLAHSDLWRSQDTAAEAFTEFLSWWLKAPCFAEPCRVWA